MIQQMMKNVHNVSFLPVCMGGCPSQRLDEEKESCCEYKHNLDYYLQSIAERLYYDKYVKKKSS